MRVVPAFPSPHKLTDSLRFTVPGSAELISNLQNEPQYPAEQALAKQRNARTFRPLKAIAPPSGDDPMAEQTKKRVKLTRKSQFVCEILTAPPVFPVSCSKMQP
jgi:hypothetical protein